MSNRCRFFVPTQVGRLSLWAVILVAFFCSCQLQAQEQGTISGLVTDASGSAIPNAHVKITNEQTALARDIQTNQAGNYTAPNLVVGKYDLEVSAPGFATYKQTGIPVNVNDNLRIDAHLEVGAVQETVEVQANAVQVQAEDATVGQVVNSTQVEDLSVNGPELQFARCPGSRSFVDATCFEHARWRNIEHQHLLQRNAAE